MLCGIVVTCSTYTVTVLNNDDINDNNKKIASSIVGQPG